MTNYNFFSPSLSLISVEKLISVDLINDKQRESFSGLQQSQQFFCDFLPVATEFIYEFNAVRNMLRSGENIDNIEDQRIHIEKCDERIGKAHQKGVDFVVKWASNYFSKSLSYSRPREDVTVTLRYFNIDGATEEGGKNYVATSISSHGSRTVTKELSATDDSSLADYVYSTDTQKTKTVGVYHSNNLIEWAVNNDFVHPALTEGNHPSRRLLSDAYNSRWHAFFRRSPEQRLTKSVLNQWEACWIERNEAISSIAVFPITLSNNSISDNLKRVFKREEESFDPHEVFGVLSVDSKSPLAFNAGDILMGKLWADALFTFSSVSTHYTEISRLRGQFDFEEVN